MLNTAEKLKISIDDYLEGELVSDIKYEYINGEVYAMAGAKRSHNLVAGNIFAALHYHLRGTPCRVFNSDMKVGILTATDDIFYYPDVHISCEKKGNEHYNTEPKLIIEVLSDSTERKDRVEKFYTYRKLASLEEYVLVAQDCFRVEIYRRRTNWDVELLKENDPFQLESVELNLSIAEVYQGVEL
jgi:Uma2 family endonuclease